MPVNFSDILVIGVSSRALFNLEEENAIFDKEGIEGYRKYQLKHENEPLLPGSAFYLLKSLLELNNQADKERQCDQEQEEVLFCVIHSADPECGRVADDQRNEDRGQC